jgi:hypothetical protein
MVDEVHLRRRVALCPIHLAIKRRVRDVIRGLPDIREL